MRVLIYISFLFLLAGCADDYKDINFKDFNTKIQNEHLNNAEWVKSPIMVSLFLADGQIDNKETNISVRALDKGESINKVKVQIESQDFLDDSVEGSKFEITLSMHSDGYWIITDAKKTWKCKSGRGHIFYGNTPCE